AEAERLLRHPARHGQAQHLGFRRQRRERVAHGLELRGVGGTHPYAAHRRETPVARAGDGRAHGVAASTRKRARNSPRATSISCSASIGKRWQGPSVFPWRNGPTTARSPRLFTVTSATWRPRRSSNWIARRCLSSARASPSTTSSCG